MKLVGATFLAHSSERFNHHWNNFALHSTSLAPLKGSIFSYFFFPATWNSYIYYHSWFLPRCLIRWLLVWDRKFHKNFLFSMIFYRIFHLILRKPRLHSAIFLYLQCYYLLMLICLLCFFCFCLYFIYIFPLNTVHFLILFVKSAFWDLSDLCFVASGTSCLFFMLWPQYCLLVQLFPIVNSISQFQLFCQLIWQLSVDSKWRALRCPFLYLISLSNCFRDFFSLW